MGEGWAKRVVDGLLEKESVNGPAERASSLSHVSRGAQARDRRRWCIWDVGRGAASQRARLLAGVVVEALGRGEQRAEVECSRQALDRPARWG